MKTVKITDSLVSKMINLLFDKFSDDNIHSGNEVTDKMNLLTTNKATVKLFIEECLQDNQESGYSKIVNYNFDETQNILSFNQDNDYELFIKLINKVEDDKLSDINENEEHETIISMPKGTNSGIFKTIRNVIGILILIILYYFFTGRDTPGLTKAALIIGTVAFTLIIAGIKGFKIVNWIFASSLLGLIVILFLPSAEEENIEEEIRIQRRENGNGVGKFLSYLSFIFIGVIIILAIKGYF